MTNDVGICGTRSEALRFPDGTAQVEVCDLSAGHSGWHHSGDRHYWGPNPVISPAPTGVWVVYTWDSSAYVHSIHASEVEALRVVNDQGYGKAALVPFGVDFAEAIK